jgi:hypothetical protein
MARCYVSAEELSTLHHETLKVNSPRLLSQPELLARHCTEAGLIEKAAHFWGKTGSGRWSARHCRGRGTILNALARSQPCQVRSPHEEIKLQVALITPLLYVKVTPRRKQAAAERARLLIEQTEALGEPSALCCVLGSIRHLIANFVPYNGELLREIAAQF